MNLEKFQGLTLNTMGSLWPLLSAAVMVPMCRYQRHVTNDIGSTLAWGAIYILSTSAEQPRNYKKKFLQQLGYKHGFLRSASSVAI